MSGAQFSGEITEWTLRVYTSALSHSDHITEWTLRFYASAQSVRPLSVSVRFPAQWPDYEGDTFEFLRPRGPTVAGWAERSECGVGYRMVTNGPHRLL